MNTYPVRTAILLAASTIFGLLVLMGSSSEIVQTGALALSAGPLVLALVNFVRRRGN